MVLFLWALFGISVCLIIHFWWSRRRLRELTSKIPGPWPIPIFGHTLDGFKTPEEIYDMGRKFSVIYGDTYILWLVHKPYVMLSNPQDVEIVLSKRFNDRDPFLMRVVNQFLGQGLITSNGDYWKRHRKVIAPTFGVNMLNHQMDCFNENAQILVRKLSPFANGNAFNLGTMVDLCTLDSICKVAFGIQMFSQSDKDHPVMKAIRTMLDLIYDRTTKPWLLIDWLFYMTKKWRDQQNAIKIIHEFSEDVITKKYHEYCEKSQTDTEGPVGKSFLDFTLSSAETVGEVMTVQEVRDEAYTLLFAGQDTTATTSCYVLTMLALHPSVQERVFEELQQIFEQDAERPVVWEDLSKLQYLDKVIKETQRLYPVVALLPRVIHEEVKLSKYTLPAGCTAVVCNALVQRNPEYFPDPEKFDPERFLPENVKARHPYSYIPFGAGPRMCVGYKYAMVLMKVLLATVLRRYQVQPACTLDDIRRTSFSMTNKPVVGFRIKMLPRDIVQPIVTQEGQ